MSDRLTSFAPDRAVARWFHDLATSHDAVATTGRVLDAALEPAVLRALLVASGIVLVLTRRRRPREVAVVVVAALVLGALAAAAKAAVGRPRPQWSDPVLTVGGTSMPSLHALNAALLVGVGFALVAPWVHGTRRRLAVVLAVLVVSAAGIDRLVVGVHYLSDVLVGWVVGALLALALARLVTPTPHPTPQHPIS